MDGKHSHLGQIAINKEVATSTSEGEHSSRWRPKEAVKLHPLLNSQRRSQAYLAAQKGLCIAAAKRFIFDLDKPPSERWNQICEAYRDHFVYIEQYMKNYIKTFSASEDIVRSKLRSRYKEIARATSKSYPGKAYDREIKAIAQRMNCDEIWIYAWQLIYETESACTSVVVRDENGIPHHIRSLDWSMDLGPMIIELDVRKNGKTLFVAPTVAYYVGMLTGMKPGCFSVSLNQRDTPDGSIKKNFKMFIDKGWPVGYLIRAVLETVDNYEDAVDRFSSEPVVAPAYIIVSGAKDEGAIITRSHTQNENPIHLKDGTLIQTNVDHWEVFGDKDRNLKSFQRSQEVRNWIDDHKPQDVNPNSLWEMLSIEPIANQCSIFGAYMCAATGTCDTRIVPLQGRGYTPTSFKAFSEAVGHSNPSKLANFFWMPVDEASNTESRDFTDHHRITLDSYSSETEIVIEQAINLKKKDFSGRTDPYCFIKYEGKAQITITHAATVNPYWHHVMYFAPNKLSITLKLEVIDKRSKKLFGKRKVTLDLQNTGEYWIPLNKEEDLRNAPSEEEIPEICIIVRRPKFTIDSMTHVLTRSNISSQGLLQGSREAAERGSQPGKDHSKEYTFHKELSNLVVVERPGVAGAGHRREKEPLHEKNIHVSEKDNHPNQKDTKEEAKKETRDGGSPNKILLEVAEASPTPSRSMLKRSHSDDRPTKERLAKSTSSPIQGKSRATSRSEMGSSPKSVRVRRGHGSPNVEKSTRL